MVKLVLIRHGQSTWNAEGKFTGWTDVPLTDVGRKEAKKGGMLLKNAGYHFDLAYTSYLVRAKETLDIVLKAMGEDVPIKEFWQLNERHYGALQGMNKKEMTAKFGEEQVHKWRRGFAIQPPALDKKDKRFPGHDLLYKGVDAKLLPTTESMKDTIARVMPFWKKEVVPRLKKGEKLLIVSHGNTMRAIMKHLEGISDNDITEVNVPTGFPLVYEFDLKLHVKKKYYLGDKKEIDAAMNAVKNQAKKN